jgi:hypothetical protein
MGRHGGRPPTSSRGETSQRARTPVLHCGAGDPARDYDGRAAAERNILRVNLQRTWTPIDFVPWGSASLHPRLSSGRTFGAQEQVP